MCPHEHLRLPTRVRLVLWSQSLSGAGRGISYPCPSEQVLLSGTRGGSGLTPPQQLWIHTAPWAWSAAPSPVLVRALTGLMPRLAALGCCVAPGLEPQGVLGAPGRKPGPPVHTDKRPQTLTPGSRHPGRASHPPPPPSLAAPMLRGGSSSRAAPPAPPAREEHQPVRAVGSSGGRQGAERGRLLQRLLEQTGNHACANRAHCHPGFPRPTPSTIHTRPAASACRRKEVCLEPLLSPAGVSEQPGRSG